MPADAEPAANSVFPDPHYCSQTRKTAEIAGFVGFPTTSQQTAVRGMLPGQQLHIRAAGIPRLAHTPVTAAWFCRRSQMDCVRVSMLHTLLLLLLPCPLPWKILQADDPPVRSVRDTVADQLLLQDGTRLKGIAVSKKPPRLLVRTGWLRLHAPAFLERSVRPAARKSLQTSAARLQELLTEAAEHSTSGEKQREQPENLARTTLLQEVLQRLQPDDELLPTHVVVESRRATFRTADLRSEPQRMLGLRASLADLTDFENLHWKTVASRLQQAGPAAAGFPEPAAEITESQLQQAVWCILAAIDVRTNEAVRLIRSGTAIIDEDSRPDPAQLLQAAASQSLGGVLQELLNEASGQPATAPAAGTGPESATEALPAAAVAIAAQRQRRTVVLSEFSADPGAGQAAVRRTLWYQASAGTWHLVAAAQGTANVGENQPEDAAALQQDPQIQQITELAAILGLPRQQMQTALGMGAVVQRALQRAGTQFDELLQQALTARLLFGFQRPLLIQEDAVD